MRSYIDKIKKEIKKEIKKINNSFSSNERIGWPTFFVVLLFSGAFFSIRNIICHGENLTFGDKFFYTYMLVVIAISCFFFIASYFFYSKKFGNSLRGWRFFVMYCCLILLVIAVSPVFMLLLIGQWIGSYFRIESVCKNFFVIQLDVVIYILGFIFCLTNSKILSMNFFWYNITIGIIYFLCYLLTIIIEKVFVLGSFYDKYSFRVETKSLLIYITSIVIMLSSVGGLFISKLDNSIQISYLLMPLIIFSGISQVLTITSKREKEKNRFLNSLYEELVILYEVAIPQLDEKYFDYISIKIRLSLQPYVIEAHEKYLKSIPYIETNKSKKKRQLMLERMFEQIKKMLQDEYKIYKDREEIQRLQNDVWNSINCLAQYLLKYEK